MLLLVTLGPEYTKRLADRGHSSARDADGFCFVNGLNSRQDDAEAVRYFRSSADQQHPDGQFFDGNLSFAWPG